jgi:hypothetical protein
MRRLHPLLPLVLFVALGLTPGSATADQCSATAQCPDGSSLSCQGVDNCASVPNQWVECDGDRINCAAGPGPCFAQVTCSDGSTISCAGSDPDSCFEDSCQVFCGFDRVACPGHELDPLCLL